MSVSDFSDYVATLDDDNFDRRFASGYFDYAMTPTDDDSDYFVRRLGDDYSGYIVTLPDNFFDYIIAPATDYSNFNG